MMAVRAAPDCTRRQHRNREASELAPLRQPTLLIRFRYWRRVAIYGDLLQLHKQLQLSLRGPNFNCNCNCTDSFNCTGRCVRLTAIATVATPDYSPASCNLIIPATTGPTLRNLGVRARLAVRCRRIESMNKVRVRLSRLSKKNFNIFLKLSPDPPLVIL